MEGQDVDRCLEALLFVADGPASLPDLARALEVTEEEIKAAIERLQAREKVRGLRITHAGNRVQFVTAPDTSEVVERFLGISASSKLSNAALETLAIVAYRQPITRAQVESLRGVNSDAVIRSLMAKALIAEVGRLEQAGRPTLLGTTFEFLQYFGIAALGELPPLPDIEGDPQSGANALEAQLDAAKEE